MVLGLWRVFRHWWWVPMVGTYSSFSNYLGMALMKTYLTFNFYRIQLCVGFQILQSTSPKIWSYKPSRTKTFGWYKPSFPMPKLKQSPVPIQQEMSPKGNPTKATRRPLLPPRQASPRLPNWVLPDLIGGQVSHENPLPPSRLACYPSRCTTPKFSIHKSDRNTNQLHDRSRCILSISHRQP